MAEATARSSSPDTGPRPRALDFAYARLARRAHSQGELTLKLERAGYPEGEIRDTIERLRSLRYLDDESFATSFALQAVERKRWGPARIEQSLRERCLADSLIAQALRAVFPDGEDGTAREALSRFNKRAPGGTPRQRKARAYRHLLSRGFSPSVVDDILEDEEFDEEE